jgi:uncharacterized protein DUF6345
MRKVALSLTIVLLFGCAHHRGGYGGTGYGGSRIKWSAQIPEPRGPLPVLRLTPLPPATDVVERVIAGRGGALRPLAEAPFLRENKIDASRDVMGSFEDDHMKAWVDLKTGNLAVYPTLTKIAPIGRGDISRATELALQVLRSGDFLGKDDTRIEAVGARVLDGTTVTHRNGATRTEREAAPYLVYIPARRFVDDLPVYGLGSRALVIAGAGRIEGLTRQWKSGRKSGTVDPALDTRDVQREIERQLGRALKRSTVEVLSVELAYYDGDRELLQPVYRFTARQHQDGGRTVDDGLLVGFVPYGKELEAIPSLSDRSPIQPKTPEKRPSYSSPNAAASATPTVADPIVGRYVVREDDQGFVDNANGFWNGLQSGWGAPLFTNAQYYWAEQRLFTNEKDFFINSVNLAEIEVHGDWWLYSTRSNCCDLVNVNGDIPSPGYGRSANGQLADWIIRSCEVVPAPDDTASWPDPWWTIFGGVRNVVGFRTIAWIVDGSGQPYGTSLANGAPVVSAWLSDASSLSAYAGNPMWVAHGGINRPMGRASTISACGHDSDSVFTVSTLPRADCLTVWWFPD